MSNHRNRAWRRFQTQVKSHGHGRTDGHLKREKNWKLLYLRSEKLSRAKQLGFVYPRQNLNHLLEDE